MKFLFLIFGTAALAVMTAACSSAQTQTDKQVEEALRRNPDLVFKVIEENPEKFIETVNQAAKAAQGSRGQAREKMAEARMAAELKEPKKPSIDDSRILIGPMTATITVVEYGDFQCSYCAVGAQNFNAFKDKYPDQVRFIFKHMPLDFHPQARNAAIAFEIVRRESKDKAHKFYLAAFAKPGQIESESDLEKILKDLGYDWKTLKKSKQAGETKKTIDADIEEFKKFGYNGTPVFVVNGLSLEGAQPTSAFEKAVDMTRKN